MPAVQLPGDDIWVILIDLGDSGGASGCDGSDEAIIASVAQQPRGETASARPKLMQLVMSMGEDGDGRG